MGLIETLNTQANNYIAHLEELAQKEIQEVLSFKIDNALVQQLKVTAPKLKTILEIEEDTL